MMTWMRNFKIRLRMQGAIGIVLALFALVGATGLIGGSQMAELNTSFMTASILEIKDVASIREHLGAVRLYEKSMVIDYENTASVQAHAAKWRESVASLNKAINALLEGEEDEDNAVAREALKDVAAYTEGTSRVIKQIEAGAFDNARTADKMLGRAKESIASAETKFEKIEQIIDNEALSTQREFNEKMHMTLIMFIGVLAVVVIVVVPATLLNSASIIKPMMHATEIANAIAEGDLTHRIDATGKDEAGELLRSLQHMQQSLAGLVGEVRSTSGSIHAAASEVASGNTDLSARTEQAASSLEETASAMEELTGTVRQSADSANHASELAGSASSVAERGGEVVAQVVHTMDEINSASRKIADIISVIDGIAFQTNILALNAAVEAARAGEQGRGFAVVAGEVRSLAGRSAEAAREIKRLINASVEKVDTGARLVQDAGSTMGDIVSSVQRVTAIVREISTAASEQSKGINQVNSAVVQLDQMTQQNAALVEESAAAAESLKDQASRLNSVVARFRVDASSPVAAPVAVPAPKAPAASPTSAAEAKPAASPSKVTKPAATSTVKAVAKPAAAPAPRAQAATAATSAAINESDWETF
ncbi:methyl-accepting chemotaxis protein [Ideonella azotifigens]|uniref:Methyl-accepting chemotaxis protein n=2 Tax=Ideonella azotifigens TaxID=513160 RepID=A0ABP3VFU1_9BURK|nr:methyl-accepting chemotaxis protein [Ideonella azotifigens]MCD2342279.1 methyl-accepting chemotaxis protein [Ideonella azotifigens]